MRYQAFILHRYRGGFQRHAESRGSTAEAEDLRRARTMTGALPQATLQRILLRQPTRGQVYAAIKMGPGSHVRALSRSLGLALGTVEHHVRQLEKHGMVFAYQAGRRRTLYAAADIDARDAAIIHAVAKPLWADILRTLLEQPEVGVATLARKLGLPPSSLSHHLGRLRVQGFLEQHKVGRESIYLLSDPIRLQRHLPPRPFVGLVQRAQAHTRRRSTNDAPTIDRIAPIL